MAIKIFISYSSKDIRFVEKIELLLARKFKNKIDTVISAQQKEIGRDISEKIIGNIVECKWFLALLTRNSTSNPTVMHELGYANAFFKSRLITQIIPVVERMKDDSGKYIPIDTGVFFDRNIESAKYIAEEDKWDECINDIAEYLGKVYEKEMKPEHEVLVERAEHLSQFGHNWEAAENYKEAGILLTNQAESEKRIDNYRKAAQQYTKSQYYWEAAEQHNTIGEILEKSGKASEAADEYKNRGDLLGDRRETIWEAANSYVQAGELYEKVGNLPAARYCYERAVELFNAGSNDFEADELRKRLKKLQ